MLMEKVNWLRFVILVVCFLSIVVTGCTTREKAKAERATDISSGPSAAAQLLDLSQRYLTLAEANDDFLRNGSGFIERTLPDRSLNGIKQVAAQAEILLRQLDAITISQLPHEDSLTAALLRRDLEILIEAPDHHWLFFDATPYNSGYVMSAELLPALSKIDLAAPGGVEHYLSLFSDSGRFLDELASKLQEQRQRGIMLPKAAIPGIRKIYSGLRENLSDSVRFDPSRLAGMDSDQVR